MPLLDTLQGMYDSSSGTLRLEAAGLGVPELADFLATFLRADTLVVGGVTSAPAQTGDTIQIVGKTLAGSSRTDLLFPADGVDHVELDFLSVDAQAHLILSVFLTPAWHFSQSFPILYSTFWDDLAPDPASRPALLLASAQVTHPASQRALPSGISFLGGLQPGAGAITPLQSLIGAAPPPAFGPIALQADGSLQADLTLFEDTWKNLFDGVEPEVRIHAVNRADGLSGVSVELGVEWSGTTIALDTTVTSADQGLLDIRIDDNLALPSPTDLARFFGGNDFAGNLPDDFKNPTGLLQVSEIGFGVDTHAMRLAYAALKLTALTDHPLTIIPPDVIVVEDLEFYFHVYTPADSPTSTSLLLAGTLEIEGVYFEVSASLPPFRISASLEEDSVINLTQIARHFGLGDGAPDIDIEEVSFSAAPAPRSSYAMQASIEEHTVPTKGDGFVLDQLLFQLDSSPDKTEVSLTAAMTIGGVDVSIAVDNSNGWEFAGHAAQQTPIPLTDVVTELGQQFNYTFAPSLGEMQLKNIDVTFKDTPGATKLDFSFTCTGDFTIADQPVEIVASIVVGDDVTVDGTLDVAGEQFKVEFQESPQSKALSASWKQVDKPLSFGDVASTFGLDVSGVPTALVPALVSVSFEYDFDAGLLELTATTADTQTVFISKAGTGANTRISAALLGVNISATLADLPLVGQKLAAVENIGVDGLQAAALAFSSPLTIDDVNSLNQSIQQAGATLPRLPSQPIDQHFILTIPLQFGNTPQPPLAIPLGGGGQSSSTALARTGGPPAAPGGSQATWLNVQKSFGPVSVKRIGVMYRDSQVWLLLDAGLSLAGLMVDLDGLSLGFTLHLPPALTPALQGMGITFKGGPVEISGGLLRVVDPDGTVEYNGEALIEAASFSLQAIGSYAEGKQPSLFLFAMLDAPLGGPSYFFVTGLAAGFGYNRSLHIPTLDDLPKFPLVSAAMANVSAGNPFAGAANDPAAALTVMHDYVPITYGEDWLAVGVRFTSFELLQSFALVTVQFGTHFELALLGLSALTMPTGAETPIGFVELALEVTFSPDSGLLAVGARLTSESYVLDKSCKLTGGFAFWIWFKDTTDGAHVGDFVVTLGGYHPAYNRPKYFPTEPRVGANWPVTPNLNVKGGLYFALTPSAVMAGGSLEAVWQSGNLRAWFNADADFLLAWKPFHYQAHLDLSLGASYKVNLLFTSVTVTVHVGVNLDLWGPRFAGIARVDLHVVSFTIRINDSSPSVQPISWQEFKDSFLPPVMSGPSKPVPAMLSRSSLPAERLAVGPPPTPTNTYCYTRIAAGLVTDLSGDPTAGGLDWVVSPETLQLVTHTAIPATRATLVTGDGTAHSKTVELSGNWTTDGFGIGPVAIADGDLDSHHVITIYKTDGSTIDYAYDFSSAASTAPILERLPAAAWSKDAALDPSLARLNSESSTIERALVGFTVGAVVNPPDHTPLPIDVGTLQDTVEPTQQHFRWSSPAIPTHDPFDQEHAMDTFETSLVDPTVVQKRAGILQALAAQGLGVATTVDVSALARSAADVLLSPPVLSYLGEEPAQ